MRTFAVVRKEAKPSPPTTQKSSNLGNPDIEEQKRMVAEKPRELIPIMGKLSTNQLFKPSSENPLKIRFKVGYALLCNLADKENFDIMLYSVYF